MLAAIVSQNSFVLVFVGYRTIIAQYVAKWGIAQMCLCETKCQGGVSHHFPKNLFGSFKTFRVISICKVIFGDPPEIPFKTSVKLTSLGLFNLARQFLPCKVKGQKYNAKRFFGFGGVLTSLKKYRGIRGIAPIVSQYRAIFWKPGYGGVKSLSKIRGGG